MQCASSAKVKESYSSQKVVAHHGQRGSLYTACCCHYALIKLLSSKHCRACKIPNRLLGMQAADSGQQQQACKIKVRHT